MKTSMPQTNFNPIQTDFYKTMHDNLKFQSDVSIDKATFEFESV